MAKKPKTPKLSALRRIEAFKVRVDAAKLAFERSHPTHRTNNEEENDDLKRLTNFRKGMPHSDEGVVEESDYDAFKKACESQSLDDFECLPIDSTVKVFRKWESPTAGAIYDLEGPDAQAVTMPPAPKLASDELASEMAEVYLMALLRDVPFTDFKTDPRAKCAAKALNDMPWFKSPKGRGPVTVNNLFRGQGEGVCDGPLISQFLLVGTPDITEPKTDATKAKGINSHANGMIEYGAQLIDQRVRTALPYCDFMQNLFDWVEVQRGEDIANVQKEHFEPDNARRFITTPRDIATYVHFDQLYQAYLNACLILLASKADFQDGLPHFGATRTKGFAQFGGPHILTLVTEVATRALKAVRFQKFTKHRRGRPEQLAGLISQYKKFENEAKNPFAAMRPLVENLDAVIYDGAPLLDAIYGHNEGQGYFLPMGLGTPRSLVPVLQC
jgi:hypothetical protein